MIQRIHDLIKEENPLAIYGTGFVADRFYRWLEEHHAEEKVCCFVVSNGANGERFHDLPVIDAAQCATKLSKDTVLCVAVHEALKEEVEACAREAYAGEILFVGNVLMELLFEPFGEVRTISLSELVHAQEEETFWLAVRYALIKQKREPAGSPVHPFEAADLYERALSLNCSRATAARRRQQALQLAESIAEYGFDPSKPILLDKDFHILDGLHRVAAAIYFGIRELPCRIAEGSERFEDVLGDRVRLTASLLKEKGFTEEEIEALRKVNAEMKEAVDHGEPAVTVIMPVYNVADYIDECMETVVHQTFRDFEVLLINDGSSDDSLEKCRSWEEKDTRVQVITRANKGVAASRNEGVEKARGTFIAFIDPDDWIELTYLEKLYHRLLQTGADYAECDLWRYDNRTGKKRLRTCYGRMGVPYTLCEHMIYCATAPYKSMSRRSMWINHQIKMPSCSFESPAVYALVVALAGGVESIREPLYYYRIARENSLIENGYAKKDGSANNTLAVEAMAYLVSEFKRCGLYETYKETLEEAVRYRLSDILATQFFRKHPDDYRELVANQRAFLQEAFPGRRNETYLTWGGYNLNRVMAYVNMLHDPDGRINFSSLVSVVGEKEETPFVFAHKNRYREIMLQRESDLTVWDLVEMRKPSYVFVDLIDERFDLLEGDHRYYTISDAFEGALNKDELLEKGRIIPRNSEECTQLWKKSAAVFVERLKEIVPQVQVVIVENYLSETVGSPNERAPFANIEEIRSMNTILKEYYAALKELCPDAVVVEAYKEELYFTDTNYQYGAIPSHLNEIVNQKIAQKIGEQLW